MKRTPSGMNASELATNPPLNQGDQRTSSAKVTPIRSVTTKAIFEAWGFLRQEVATGLEDKATFSDPPGDTPALKACADWLAREMRRRRRLGFRLPKGAPR